MYEELTERILNCAYKVHSKLGAGMLESVYQRCLSYELTQNGINNETEKVIPLKYGDLFVENAFKIDILVENSVIIELKSVEKLHELHQSQILSYMKTAGKRVGLLINFNVGSLRNGMKTYSL